ncbi:MAG: rhamnulokinase [Thermoprotei archaeon]
MPDSSSLSIDLGASGGKAFIALLKGDGVSLREVRRFSNSPVKMGGHLYWDVPRLWEEIKSCLYLAKGTSSVGIDTWGVDFALFRDGDMVGLPYAYRDPSFKGAIEQVLKLITREEIFERTGIQFLEFNTIYQLFWISRHAAHRLPSSLFMIPDVFHALLTGRWAGERTNATTTQLMGVSGEWLQDLLQRLDVRVSLPPALEASTVLGELTTEVQEEVGTNAEVVLPATHDTSSAIAAAPISDGIAYVSSGTWDLVGLELDHPVMGEEVLENNFSNEGGAFSRFNFLKNVQGMWIVQGLKRSFERVDGREYSYDEIVSMASSSADIGSYVDVDDRRFLLPSDMAEEILSYLEETGQRRPMGKGELIRLVLRSLSLKRRYVVEMAGRLAGKKIRGVSVVGGGSRNWLLNQMTADALGVPVTAGPDEATAIGNALVQQVGLGNVRREKLRDIVRESFSIERFEPRGKDDFYPDFLRATGLEKRLGSAASALNVFMRHNYGANRRSLREGCGAYRKDKG